MAALLLTAAPCRAGAQQLPFNVGIVDWEPEAYSRQRRSYSVAANEYEVLFCVETWKALPAENGIERFVIGRVRREKAGGARRISDVGALCIGPDGTALPMIHTHPDGNCQFSPSDLVTIIARNAPFEGVQCGEHHLIWHYAWQLRAIAEFVDRKRLNRSASPP